MFKKHGFKNSHNVLLIGAAAITDLAQQNMFHFLDSHTRPELSDGDRDSTQYTYFFLFFFYLFRCPTSYERAQNTRLHR